MTGHDESCEKSWQGKPAEPDFAADAEASARLEESDAQRLAFEQRLGHRFADPRLLEVALTHSSAAHDDGVPSYERLEFLGDSVLGLVAARWLFERMPEAREGELARWKAYLVSARVLARWAGRLQLGPLLRLGTGEERSGGRRKRSLLADSAESVIGAMFLDGGFDAARRAVEPWLDEVHRAHPGLEYQDAKTQLQELLQAAGREPPEYPILARSGPDHARVYEVACTSGRLDLGHGAGPSKKRAEQRAARLALERLRSGELALEGPASGPSSRANEGVTTETEDPLQCADDEGLAE